MIESPRRIDRMLATARWRCRPVLLGAALALGSTGAPADETPGLRLAQTLTATPVAGLRPPTTIEDKDDGDRIARPDSAGDSQDWEFPGEGLLLARSDTTGSVSIPATDLGANAEILDPDLSAAAAATPPARAAAAPTPGRRWGLAPLQWRGTIGNYYNYATSQGFQSTSNQDRIDLQGRSYVLSPSFLPISGNVNGGRSTSGSTGSADTSSMNFGLGLNATYLPFSRSPLVGDYSFSRSDFGAGNPVTSQSAGVTQTFVEQGRNPMVPPGTYTYQARRNATATGATSNLSDALSGTFSTNYRNWNLSANGNAQHQTSDNRQQPWTVNLSGSGSRTYVFEDYDATLNGTLGATYFSTDNRSGTLWNGNSVADWYPDIDSPLQIVFRSQANYAQITDQQIDTRFGSAVVDASGRYPVSKNLNYSGGLIWNGFWDPNGSFAQGLSGNANVNYGSDSRDIRGFSYTWGASAGLGANLAGSIGSSQSLNTTLSVNHGISRTFVQSTELFGSVSASQAATASFGGDPGQRLTVTSSADTAWTYTPVSGTSLRGNARYLNEWTNEQRSGLDGSGSNMRQSLSGSLIGSYQFHRQLSGHRSLNGNANLSTLVAWSSTQNSTASGVGSSIFNWGGFGAINYLDSRFGGWPGLSYNAGYSMFLSPKADTGTGSTGGVQVSHSFTHSLTYLVGRLSFSASNSFVQVGGVNSVTLFVTVQRQIGQ